MNRDLIIDARKNDAEIALLEDKVLVELHKQKSNAEFAVGDIYLGKVKKIMTGLNAAFIDIGYEKDAFLHYLDLGLQVKTLCDFTKQALTGRTPTPKVENTEMAPDIDKTGKISKILTANQLIMVQVAKEPISTKGPRVTSEITLAGRYVVLIPFSDKVSVSQKVKSIEERKRLKRIVNNIRAKGFGVIIRTVAEHKTSKDIESDLNQLMAKWDTLTRRLAHAKPRKKLHSELDRTSTILRDILNESFNNVVINDQNLANEMRSYIQSIAPEKASIVKAHKSRVPIFEEYGIDKQIKSSFGRTVTIKGGVYLIIEQTEAMFVIDVNSGNRTKKTEDQEESALGVNKDAATEIARQLRLRDMGGIIVVDFIDLHTNTGRKELYDHLKEEMKKDSARHTILPPSRFGVIEITRQRVRPATSVDVVEKCPTCHGSGEIRPSILITDEIENNISYLIHEQNEKSLSIVVHPILFGYLTKGLFNQRWKWNRKYKEKIRITSDQSYQLTEYHFFNKNGEEIRL
ncbi:MAG: Rne/Rng family ribonuclease [Bacteroidales bacterium]|nr:Rne/Rng family ribonuclease [Bacteroidales bacterium]